MMQEANPDRGKIEELLAVIGQGKNILILCHSNPDPDTIGGAFALQHLIRQILNRKAVIAFDGHIGRAENRQFVRRLKIAMFPVTEIDFDTFSIVCLIDTQPNTGNNALPRRIRPHVVIDHHPLRRDTLKSPFWDVRTTYGSTSTIIVGYFRAWGIEPDKRVATALFYGLKTDTNNLVRSRERADLDAFNYLFPKVDLSALASIESPAVPRSYFQKLAATLENCSIFKDVVITTMDRLTSPEFVAEMAEMLLRIEHIRWSFCLGRHDDGLYLSVRTTRRGWYAGEVARKMLKGIGTGGGHEQTAGGYVDLRGKTSEEIRHLEAILIERFKKNLGIQAVPGRPLIEKRP